MIRLGLIGCGEHAEVGHAIPLSRYKTAHPDQVELTAACDVRLPRARDFCQRYGFQNAYGSVGEMLQKAKVDGCLVIVPPEHIAEVGTDLLRRGIPCVVEKPLGTSPAELASLLETAKTTRTSNMVSVNRRFMPFLNRALEWSRSIGPLGYVRCTMTRHARSEPDFIWTTAIHAVDALRYIAGEVAESNLRRVDRGGTASWYGIDFRFEGGTSGRIDVLPTTGTVEEIYELFGDGFQATVASPFGAQRFVRCFQDKKLVLEEVAGDQMPEDMLNGGYAEAEEFIRALSLGHAPRPSIEDVAPSVRLCFMLARNMEGTT